MALILRLYEWAGKQSDVHITVPEGAIRAAMVNLMEQPAGSSLAVNGGNQIVAPIHPYEILTIRVNYSPQVP